MAGTADIIIDTRTDVLTVPSSAISSTGGTTVAKTLVNGKEVDVPVEVGISSDTNTEIISGLTEGETVITAVINSTATTSSTTQTRSVFSTGGLGGGNTTFRTTSGGGAVRGAAIEK
jgi:macrolide-specific efflux system membrane fusion protein